MPPKKNRAKGKDKGKAGPKPLPKVRTGMPELRCGKAQTCDDVAATASGCFGIVLPGALSAAACL